jgi:hypothetical protein
MRLWRALNRPPRHHPLYRYVLTHARREEPRVTSGFFMWIFMCSTLTFFWTIVFDWVPFLLLGMLLVFNTFYAVRWTLRISQTIVLEKEHGRYDLLASLPIGLLGTSWAISTGCAHRRTSFRWMPYLVLLFAIVIAATLIVTIGITVVIMQNVSGNEEALRGNFEIIEVGSAMIPGVLLFYVDHVYSTLTAILLGQAAAVDVLLKDEARMRALLGFLTGQVLTYLFCYSVVILALGDVLRLLGISSLTGILIQSAFGVLMYIVLREWQVKRLWRHLTDSLQADTAEIELVLTSLRA